MNDLYNSNNEFHEINTQTKQPQKILIMSADLKLDHLQLSTEAVTDNKRDNTFKSQQASPYSANYIRLKRPEQSIALSYSLAKHPLSYAIPCQELKQKAREQEGSVGYVYTRFEAPGTSEDFPLKATFTPNSAPVTYKHYLMHKLMAYFSEQPDVFIGLNFVNQLDLWFPADRVALNYRPACLPNFENRAKFTLWVSVEGEGEQARLRLHVSYNGISRISQKPWTDLGFGAAGVECKTLYQNFVLNYRENDAYHGIDWSRSFPFLNREVAHKLGIPCAYDKVNNPPLTYTKAISWFLEHVLSDPGFKACFPWLKKKSNGLVFERVNQSSTLQLDAGTTKMRFGDHSDAEPDRFYYALKNHGPYRGIPGSEVKVVVFKPEHSGLSQEDMQRFTDQLIRRISKLLRIPFNLIKVLSYNSEVSDHKAMHKQLKALQAALKGKPDLIYMLLPWHRHDVSEKTAFYHSYKALFRVHGIPSQMIYIPNIRQAESFIYHTPNTAIKVCAKLRGIPWRPASVKADAPSLVVGINAYRDPKTKQAYQAAVTLFREDEPVIQNLTCSKMEPALLASAIHSVIEQFCAQHKDAKQLVIHYYKTLSFQERRQILSTLQSHPFPLSVYIVMISADVQRQHFVWDSSSSDVLPNSGTCVEIEPNRWLLYANRNLPRLNGKGRNNGFSSSSSETYALKDFPFPVDVKLWKVQTPAEGSEANINSGPELSKQETVALLNQLYRLCFMSWTSVKPRLIPPTVRYSKRHAKLQANLPETNGSADVSVGHELFEGV